MNWELDNVVMREEIDVTWFVFGLLKSDYFREYEEGNKNGTNLINWNSIKHCKCKLFIIIIRNMCRSPFISSDNNEIVYNYSNVYTHYEN